MPVPNDAPRALSDHSATLLQDGRVLVIDQGGAPLFFDTRTGTWRPVDASGPLMPAAGHVAVLLRTGQVLVAGGDFGGGVTYRGSHLFDPATNAFTRGASLNVPRHHAAAVLLADGRVLVTGGNDSVAANASAEIFDPTTGTWSATGSMNAARQGHAMTRLPDGRVLVVGGAGTSAEIYDPAIGIFTPTLPMAVTRASASALLLPDGKVLVAGNGLGGTSSVELLDPLFGTWSPAAGPVNVVNRPSLSLLPDGRVLMVESGALPVIATQIFTPASNAWQIASSPTAVRNGHTATVLPEGRVLFIGGTGGASPTAEIYDPLSVTSQTTASGPLDVRVTYGATVLSDGRVLLFGGYLPADRTVFDDGAIYDPDADTWQSIPLLDEGRADSPTTALMRDGRVLVAGGSPDGTRPAPTRIYDPVQNTWTMAPAPAVRRLANGSVVLSNGWIVLLGGYTGSDATADVAIYVPELGRWITAAPMPVPRVWHSAIRLKDDRILVTGGYGPGGGSDPRTDAWVYDFRTNTWTAAGTSAFTRLEPEMALLPDGRVLVAGGEAAGTLEIWDPATGVWTLVPGADPGFGLTLSVLPSGEVALIGGEAAPSSIRLFDPTDNVLRPAGTLQAGRFQHRSIVLPDGRVVVLPGRTGRSTGTPTVEVVTFTRGTDPSRQPAVTLSGAPRNDGTLSLTGGPFSPAIAAASSTAATPSATNHPLAWYRSLATNDQGWLDVSSWDDTHVHLRTLYGKALGPVAIGTRVNGLASDAILGSMGATTPVIDLAPVTVTRSSAPQTISVPLRATPAFAGPASFVMFLEQGPTPFGSTTWSSLVAVDGTTTATFTVPGALPVGVYQFTALFTGNPGTEPGYKTVSLTVNAVTCPAITLTPATLTATRINQPYSVQFAASGGVAPYVFATTGTLPPGLSLTGDTLSGTLTGEPSGAFTVSVTDADGCGASQSYTLAVEPEPEPTREYTLAEGVSNSFFRSDIAIANPNAVDAPITLTYASETGATATETRTLTPFSRLTIPTGAGSVATSHGPTFATKVISEAALPLVIERATYFDGALHAGDLSSASEGGSATWFFAEGANGYFHTYLTLGNLGDQPADVMVRYLPEGGAPFDRQYAVAPHSRRTIDTRTEQALAADAFAMTVTSTVPIAADRVQYFGSPFIGAHADSGARALSSDWYFAEGASGSAFDTYLLLGNPSSGEATVTVTYHTDALETVTKTYTVRGEGRRSISVEVEDPKLAIGSFWIEAHADRPIVAERAMYLVQPGGSGWSDATDTTGATAPALRWGLAEGRAGAPLGYRSYVLIANPNHQAAEISVQYLRAAGSGAPIVHAYSVPAKGRLTLDVRGEEPTLAGAEFSIIVSSTNHQPIVAERSLYWTLGTPSLVGAMNSMGTPLPPVP